MVAHFERRLRTRSDRTRIDPFTAWSIRLLPVLLTLLLLPGIDPALAASESNATEPPGDPLAEAFGQLPAYSSPRLSPDGSRVALVVQPTNLDMPVAVVHRFDTGESALVVASERDEFDLKECRWANDERLLCTFYGIGSSRGLQFSATRLVAVDADGSDLKVLMQREVQRNLAGTGAFGQYQGELVDLLPDDPRHVLVEEPGRGGTGLSRLDIVTGRMIRFMRPRNHIYAWITDGEGRARLRMKLKEDKRTWQHRGPDGPEWRDVSVERAGEEYDGFEPIGFGDDPNRLLALRRLDDGRMALVSEDMVGEGEREVVLARDDVDVSGVMTLGPHERVVAATWETDRPHVEYFDPSLERVHALLERSLPGKAIVIVDESWDRKVYLVFAYSDVDPGALYRLDLGERRLDVVEALRPQVKGVELSPMTSIDHEAEDGVHVPGYVTRPASTAKGPSPTIVMPHGGPESRDSWGFDWLAQYLAASGYVVFQTNFRGSSGYGRDWLENGGYQSWRRVVSDIDTGLQHLIDEGITDPERVCAVGWSFGGYASLMSVLEHPKRYRCVVDIAGVADPGMLVDRYRDFINEDFVEAFVSRSDDVLKAGSPLERAEEIDVPVLIFHGDEDVNVDVDQGRKLAKALRKADKQVEYVEYEDDEHGLRRNASRIDMLTRIGAFLEANLEQAPSATKAAAPNP